MMTVAVLSQMQPGQCLPSISFGDFTFHKQSTALATYILLLFKDAPLSFY
jgi:hypothetical protein